MEIIDVLQKKVSDLVSHCQQLSGTVSRLEAENSQLKKQLKEFEAASKKDSDGLKMINQEKEMTRSVVDNLIKSIDSLMSAQ